MLNREIPDTYTLSKLEYVNSNIRHCLRTFPNRVTDHTVFVSLSRGTVIVIILIMTMTIYKMTLILLDSLKTSEMTHSFFMNKKEVSRYVKFKIIRNQLITILELCGKRGSLETIRSSILKDKYT